MYIYIMHICRPSGLLTLLFWVVKVLASPQHANLFSSPKLQQRGPQALKLAEHPCGCSA